MVEPRCSEFDNSKRDIPSFIEPRPPLISNPFMRPRPQNGRNLLELFDEDSESGETDLVQVYLRMKPCDEPSNLYEVRSEHHLITSLEKATVGHGRRTQANVSKMYTFSHIFGPNSSQKEIFETVVKGNLKKLPDGHSFTLLTYGASGSGKTYTLMGTVQSPGLVPRSLEYLFKVVDASQQPLFKPVEGSSDQLSYAEQEYELQWVHRLRQVSASSRDKYKRMSVQLRNDLTHSNFDLSGRIKHYVWVSFIEIYNEGIYDLLVTGDRRASSTLRIREDSDGNVFVKGATQAFVRSGSEAYDVLVVGKHNLQVAATGVHSRSSRSHCIFTITMLTETESGVRVSAVRLCDLAGCERVVRTHNTGPRLAESRHINSSLHVLERCLHTMRRKNNATTTQLVPYRESKLTRLLGAGLCGGEAVSMVVTLNPAPRYSHETRHVLQLAAVAKDIQINSTISESTLECSTNTTITCSAEVMRLRSENERLHFELLQSQARNKELLSSMEVKQQENAATMRELVDEAKDMTRQYYEAQIHALQSEMEEMMEEYETRLSNLAKPLSETPNRLQNRVAQLLTEVAILEEKIVAEQLARVRAEEEVQHLRACIDERDEKSEDDPETTDEGVTSLSESDNETDVCNESLEPTFKKEEINRSRQILRLSMMSDFNNTTNRTNPTLNPVDENESVVDCSNDTIKDNDNTFDVNDSDRKTNEDETTSCNDESAYDIAKESEIHCNTVNDNIATNKQEPLTRGTYFVRNSEVTISDDSNDSIDAAPATVKKASKIRGTYYVSDKENSSDMSGTEKHLPEDSFEDKPEFKDPNKTSKIISKIIKNIEPSDSIDNSLVQFEQIEKASKTCKDESSEVDDFANFKLTKPKKHFFYESTIVESQDKPKSKTVSSNDNQGVLEKVKESTKQTKAKDVNEEVLNDTKKTYFDNIPNVNNFNIAKSQDSYICKTIEDKNATEKHKEITPNKHKSYFKDDKVEVNVSEILKSIGKKTYFDNIGDNATESSNKDTRVNEIKMVLSDDRSPSIVKDEVTGKVELNAIKKFLGESLARQTAAHSVTKVAKPKKQDSLDLFESPQVKVKDQIDEIRKSIDNLKLNQIHENKIASKVISEIKIDLVTTHDKPNENVKIDQSYNDQSINTKANNTVEDFENIYKDITAPRATEFDLLVSEIDDHNATETDKQFKEPTLKDVKYNLRKTNAKFDNSAIKQLTKETPANGKKTYFSDDKAEMTKYNDSKTEDDIEKPVKSEHKKYELRNLQDELLLQSQAKCESQTKPSKRNLRLRRRKNQDDDTSDTNQDTSNDKDQVNTLVKSKAKLKDIVNLQSEFSDVTMDIPAPVKEIKDISSPEKAQGEDENLPPYGIQSCPSKSITRSRRKLFTPRAEVLDESTQGNSGEPVRVPRPSYRGPRARRRL